MRRDHFFLLIIIGLAAVLRFYGLPETLRFDGEIGHNYLAIKNIIADREIPLLGPPTSHPWLSFGPLFYWLFAPVLYLSKYDPVGPAVFMMLLSLTGIILNYSVVGKLFSRSAAVISSLLMAVSPLWVEFARGTRFYSLTALFFYPFFVYLIKATDKGKETSKNLFWLGFWFGVLLNFHLSPLALIPAILFVLVYFKAIKSLKNLSALLVGFLVPNIPFLIYNFQNKFTMLYNLLLWIPYRAAGFLGLYPKNNLTPEVFGVNITAVYKFFANTFVVQTYFSLAIVVFLMALVYVIRRAWKDKNQPNLVLLALFFSGILAVFIHGDPPIHYFLPLLPVVAIIISIFLARVWQRGWRVMVAIIFLTIFSLNLNYYFSGPLIFPVPFKTQLRVAQAIVADAKGKPFTIERTGPYDYFEGDYAQNYQYLLWLYGNEPVKNSEVLYTIDETATMSATFKIDSVAVVREEK